MLTTYWILETLIVILSIGAGWAVTNSDTGRNRNRIFLTATFIMVLSVMIVKGLRWDRGVDYSIYLGYYTQPQDPHMPGEILFYLTVNFFRSLGAPFWAFTMYLSSFFMLSVMAMTANFRRYAVWTLPAMVLLTGYASENLIRQFYAIGFIFFSSALWLHSEARRYKALWSRIASWILLTMVPLVHVTGILPVIVLTAVRLFNLYGYGRAVNYPKVPWFLAILYLCLCILRVSGWQEMVPRIAAQLTSVLTLDSSSHWDLYLIRAGEWLVSDRLPYSGSVITVTVQILWPLALILLGYRAVALDYRLTVPYWMCVCSIMILAVGGDLMVCRRMAWWGAIFTPFVGGAAMSRCLSAVPYAGISIKEQLMPSMTFCILGVCYVLTYITPFIFQWGSEPYSGYSFIWDL